MKYVKVEWPEIQDYMELPGFREEIGFDPEKNCWFIPEDWEPYYNNDIESWEDEFSGGDIGDLEDAMG